MSLLIALASPALGQTVEKKRLTLAGAKQVIAAAVAEARNKSAPRGAIAVVDDGGNLVAVERLDNTFAGSEHLDRKSADRCTVQEADTLLRRDD
jgi:hypothetical protein